jgi:TRAP-type C4-dicarboxylate transport system permease small subunit
MMKIFHFIDQLIEKFAARLLVVAVLIMLALSTFSIILRWAERSLLWIDPFVRHLVFLSALLGGILATGKGTHIGIDILGKVFETRGDLKAQKVIAFVVSVASFGVVLWLAYASYQFMLVELRYGKAAFFGIHTGILVGIIPTNLALIAYRFFYKALVILTGYKQAEVA